MNCKAIQHSDQMVCKSCGLTWNMNDLSPPECVPLQPELVNPAPLPDTVTFYISVVRYGVAGWAVGPCGTDLAYIQSTLRVYKNIDACRIYPVQLPMSAIPTA